MSCIDNPIVELKNGEQEYIVTIDEWLNVVQRDLGEEFASRYRDVEYDAEMEHIDSDLDAYESELDHYHAVLEELKDYMEELNDMMSGRINKDKAYKLIQKCLDKIIVNL